MFVSQFQQQQIYGRDHDDWRQASTDGADRLVRWGPIGRAGLVGIGWIV